MIDWLMLLKDEDIPEGDWMCIKCFAGHPDQQVQILKNKKDYFFFLNFCIKTNLWQYFKPTTHILDGLSKLRLQFLLILDNV